MDDNILICAHHEAGHAIMAYIVGWSINSITLNIEDKVLKFGVTNYDFGKEDTDASIDLDRRILCLLSGPISQFLFEEKGEMNIDNLGTDGINIDKLLFRYDSVAKEKKITEFIEISATLLEIDENKNARLRIVENLIENKNLSQEEFHVILEDFDIKRMQF